VFPSVLIQTIFLQRNYGLLILMWCLMIHFLSLVPTLANQHLHILFSQRSSYSSIKDHKAFNVYAFTLELT